MAFEEFVTNINISLKLSSLTSGLHYISIKTLALTIVAANFEDIASFVDVVNDSRGIYNR